MSHQTIVIREQDTTLRIEQVVVPSRITSNITLPVGGGPFTFRDENGGLLLTLDKDGNIISEKGFFELSGQAPPAVSPTGKMRFYFDSATNKLLLSENGGAYADLMDGAGDVVGPGSATDEALVRWDAATGKLIQNSNALLNDAGDLTLVGSFLLGKFLDTTGIAAPAVSPGGKSRLYFDSTSNKLRISENGGAFVDVIGGAGDVEGPAGATNNAFARFDTATGKLIQNSLVTADDSGNIVTPGTVDGLEGLFRTSGGGQYGRIFQGGVSLGVEFTSFEPDSASATAFTFDTVNLLGTPGARALSVRVFGAEALNLMTSGSGISLVTTLTVLGGSSGNPGVELRKGDVNPVADWQHQNSTGLIHHRRRDISFKDYMTIGIASGDIIFGDGAEGTLTWDGATGDIVFGSDGTVSLIAPDAGDGGLVDSPILNLRANFDADPTAGITPTTLDFEFKHVMLTGGASPTSKLSFLFEGVEEVNLQRTATSAIFSRTDFTKAFLQFDNAFANLSYGFAQWGVNSANALTCRSIGPSGGVTRAHYNVGSTGRTMWIEDSVDSATAVGFELFTKTLDKDTFTAGALHSKWSDAGDNTIMSVTPGGDLFVLGDIEIDGDINHDGLNVGFYGTAPAAQSAAYTRNAAIVEDRTLLASASATIINNNNVLAALIADIQATGLLG